MHSEVAAEGGRVSDVIHPLLEGADVSRGKAYPNNSKALQFAGNVHMLNECCGAFGFVHAHLELKGPAVHGLEQMTVEAPGVDNGFPILDRGPQEFFPGKLRPEFPEIDGFCREPALDIRRSALEFLPREFRCLLLKFPTG